MSMAERHGSCSDTSLDKNRYLSVQASAAAYKKLIDSEQVEKNDLLDIRVCPCTGREPHSFQFSASQ